MTIGERIRAARKAANNGKGITQKQLGELCEIAEPTIRRYELGKLNPKMETIQKIANALNLGYGFTKDGEIYFYDFVDTAPRPEYVENEKFNALQYKGAISSSQQKVDLNEAYEKLNETGQQKAVEQVQDLAKIPDYQKDKE